MDKDRASERQQAKGPVTQGADRVGSERVWGQGWGWGDMGTPCLLLSFAAN